MDLEEIHQGMELWKRRQVRLTPRHWQRTWLDDPARMPVSDAEGEPAPSAPVPPAGNVSASSAATGEDGEP